MQPLAQAFLLFAKQPINRPQQYAQANFATAVPSPRAYTGRGLLELEPYKIYVPNRSHLQTICLFCEQLKRRIIAHSCTKETTITS